MLYRSVQTFALCLLLAGWVTTGTAGTRKYPPLLQQPANYTPPTEKQKLWALATCAVLAELNGHRHDILGGRLRLPENIEATQGLLANWWHTHNREELLKTLSWIEEGGHREEFDGLSQYLTAASPAQLLLIGWQVIEDPATSNKVVTKGQRMSSADLCPDLCPANRLIIPRLSGLTLPKIMVSLGA